ncbi:helix-turn-helix domain-containing protein [Vibrio sp. SCSIO 43135]|uniref:AraC family transcriptional regulator n=1 Tax=Vibrio sp. SCSIO 43135 TaxID=2819096 RepID=UPI002075AE76|nr:AraC family transcriptional regulator [Vibrio sp. SCSIO 43135]USD44166.1 helix-turn-helix domain-containing protein [Vibrio sp. SCSIO 43135]
MLDRQERFTISDKTKHEFIDHSHVLRLEELGIVQCGIATCRDDFSVFRKHQQKHMLLYTVKGKGWLESHGQKFHLEPGSLITVPAGVENGFGLSEEDWQIAWIFLSPEHDWEHFCDSDIKYTLTPVAEVIYASILALLRSIALPIDLGGGVAIKVVEQIELMINTPMETEESRNTSRMRHVFYQVQRQLHKDWTVAQLASMLPCSEPHFHRLCQQIYGHSPKVHLTRMRMEYAARLLGSTVWSIQHIGEIVGYPNAANFSTRFKRWGGMTPREFRVRLENANRL